jgi:hypothetical protein
MSTALRVAGAAVALVICTSKARWYLLSEPWKGNVGWLIGCTVSGVNASGTFTPAAAWSPGTSRAGCIW